MIANIIVPVDGSEQALHALDHAAYLARLADARLHLLHVTASSERSHEQRAREVMEAARQRLPADLPARERVIAGDPADTILDYVSEQGAPVIVMGNRGLSGPEEWLMGSVSDKVLNQAECPVTIVR